MAASGYLLVDQPNRVTPQGGLPRRAGGKLSGTCIVHTSEGPWTNGVDALTSFLRTRSDYGSYHRACDWADIAVYFPWEWETWQDSETNVWAVGIAAACRAADWRIMPADIREGYYRNMARMAADFVKYMHTTHGITVPLKRISGAQARARVPGFAAHGDSGISRSDPGADFDWAYFFKCTAQLLNAVSPQTPVVKPKEPFTVSQFKEIMDKLERVEDIATENQRRINNVPTAILDAEYPLEGSQKGKTATVRNRFAWLPHEQHRVAGYVQDVQTQLREVLELLYLKGEPAVPVEAPKEEV